MSGFSNDIIGGMSKLIRAAIQSVNYVSGSTGWNIARDGGSEFNSGIFRGNLIVGNNSNGTPYIFAGSNSPLLKPNNVVASIDLNKGDNTGYSLELINTGELYFSSTYLTGVGVYDFAPFIWVKNYNYTGPTQGIVTFGSFSSTFDTKVIGGSLTVDTADRTLQVGTSGNGADYKLKVGGTDIGQGLLFAAKLTTSSATSPSAAESVVWTLPNKTFYAGRAYEVRGVLGASQTTANTWVAAKLRKGLAGTTLIEWYRVSTPTNGPVFKVGGEPDVFVVGASNVTTQLTVTLNASAGAYSLFGTAGGAGSRLKFYDVGSAADYLAGDPDIPVLT